ncbi:MAG TPA: hypothetical protein VJ756_01080 [Terriglobales bacterium]|nr:hypothetical protein [Terriglobales bacterium]HKU23513.1 hypothetical protein [Terriglobales bacterium]
MNKALGIAKGWAVTAIAALVFAVGSGWFINKYFDLEAHALFMRLWPPPTAQQVEIRQLRKIAGWFSRDCGHVRHRQNADWAIACAEDALRTGQRFYVSFDYVGLDSTRIIGLASNSAGVVYEVTTDQLGRGAFGFVATRGTVRTTTVTRCEKVPVEQTSYPANRYLTCLGSSDSQ